MVLEEHRNIFLGHVDEVVVIYNAFLWKAENNILIKVTKHVVFFFFFLVTRDR